MWVAGYIRIFKIFRKESFMSSLYYDDPAVEEAGCGD